MDTSSTIAMFLHFGLVGVGCLAVAEKFIPLLPSYVLLMLLGMTIPDGATLAMTILATSAGSVIGAIGWYGLWQDQPLTESAKAHDCFSHELCEAWEQAARGAEAHGTRVALLRIGLVVGRDGGVLSRMLTPFEFGLGGPLGSGRQWMSWIERDDLVRLIAHVIAKPELSGPINATAPIPVTNTKFTEELGRRLHRPTIFRVPAALLRAVGGDFADELLLGGQRVLPNKALSNGFVFRHETLRSAFEAIL